MFSNGGRALNGLRTLVLNSIKLRIPLLKVQESGSGG